MAKYTELINGKRFFKRTEEIDRMVTLYRSGSQSERLRVYKFFSSILGEELNLSYNEDFVSYSGSYKAVVSGYFEIGGVVRVYDFGGGEYDNVWLPWLVKRGDYEYILEDIRDLFIEIRRAWELNKV
jgi:hypothetical protein